MAVEKNTPSILVRARNYYRKKGFRSFFQRIVQKFQEWNLLERIAIQFHWKRIAIRRRSQPGKTEAFSATPVLSQRKDLALLFMHIPKTAGTSIRSLLERPFAAHERAYLYNESWGISLEAFRSLPNKEKEQFRLVCGHFNFGVHEWMPQEARYITILRDPVERVISLYHFIKRTPGSKHHHLIVDNNYSLEDFVFSGLFAKTDNGMVRNISGVRGVRFGECSDDVLDRAYRNIENHFECVLTMEHMQRGIAKLSEILEIPVRGFRKKNISRTPKEAIDPLLVKKIDALNRLDRELYTRITRQWEEE